ncbi:hypothetical protein ABK040_000085 [Willaertia magna]
MQTIEITPTLLNSDKNNVYLNYQFSSTKQKSIFHKKCFIGPIHAISFSKTNDNFLFAGIGPNLHIFNITNGLELIDLQIFDKGGIIKGIKSLNKTLNKDNNILQENLLIFGQKRLKILQINLKIINNNEYQFNYLLLNVGELHDWILDVFYISHLKSNYFIIGYAHNFIQLFECKDLIERNEEIITQEEKDINLYYLNTIRSYPNCLLYSMSIYFNESNLNSELSSINDLLRHVLVAAGTVFNQIILWSIENNTKEKVIALEGHDGVLFRIEWSKDGKSLCSTSDDRTLRYWKLSNVPFQQQEVKIQSIPFYGHGARVWDCKLCKDFIISSSEDSTIRVWDYEGNCISTLQGHFGRNVWRIDLNSKEEVIASGGGDSSVKLWSLKRIRDSSIINLNFNVFEKKKDQVRCMFMLDKDILIGTKNGKVMKIDHGQQKVETLLNYNFYQTSVGVELQNDNNSENSNNKEIPLLTKVKYSPCKKYYLLANSLGYCTIYNIKTNEEVFTFRAFHNTKILEVFWIRMDNDNYYSIYVTSPLGLMKRFIFDISNQLVNEEITYNVKGKVITLCVVKEEGIILTGDVKGYIHLLRINPLPSSSIKVNNNNEENKKITNNEEQQENKEDNSKIVEEEEQFIPEFILKGAHSGENQVCDIVYLNRENIYSVGRDGMICFYHLTKEENEDKFILEKQSSDKLKHVIPMIEKIVLINKSEHVDNIETNTIRENISIDEMKRMNIEIVLLGFYGPHFIAYNYTKKYRLATCYFGSSKGIFDFTYFNYYNTNQMSVFAAIAKENQVQCYHEKQEDIIPLFKNQTLFVPYHGREVCHAIQWKNKTKNLLRMITCSEDTKIRILEYNNYKSEKDKVKPIEMMSRLVLNGHESSVKSLFLVNGEDEESSYLISGGSKEQLIIWKIEEKENNQLTADIILDKSLTRTFLQIFHPDIYQNANNQNQSDESQSNYILKNESRFDAINFRILSLNVFNHPFHKDELIILVGSSDALVKIFTTEKKKTILKPIGRTNLLRGPILSMDTIVVNNTRYMFCGTTDGNVFCYELKDALFTKDNEDNYNNESIDSTVLKTIEPLFEHVHHQSGINSMHITLDENQQHVHVCTGGDDQSVHLSVFDMQSTSVIYETHLECVHSSAVNGVYTDGKYTIISTGIDQRTNVYKPISNDNLDKKNWKIVASCMNEISDMSHMEIVEKENISSYTAIIVGSGLQIIDIEL